MDPGHSHLSRSFLKCLICKNTFKDPRILPCLHTFCYECIQRLPKLEFWTVECPQCQATVKLPKGGIDGLSTNFFTNKMLHFLKIKLRDDQTLLCSNCELGEPAVSRCWNCSEFLCDQCMEAHKITRVTKQHKIFEIENEENLLNENIRQLLGHSVVCSCFGKEEVKYFCATCDEAVCGDCIIAKHKEHRFGSLRDLVGKHRGEIAVMLMKTKRKAEPVRYVMEDLTKLQNSVKENASRVRSEVKNYIAACIKTLKEYENKLLREVDYIENTKLKNLTDQEDELSLTYNRLTAGCHFAEQALQQGSEAEVMTLKKQIVRRLEELNKADADLDPCDNDIIQYEILNKDGLKKYANSHVLGEIKTVESG